MIKILLGGSPCTHWSIAQKNDKEAWIIAWKTFPEYKQLGVIPLKESDT